VNPLKGKKLTNVRASGTDEAVRLTPHIRMSLEEAIAYIDDDELVEVTPKIIRLRKRYLDPHERKRQSRSHHSRRLHPDPRSAALRAGAGRHLLAGRRRAVPRGQRIGPDPDSAGVDFESAQLTRAAGGAGAGRPGAGGAPAPPDHSAATRRGFSMSLR
jgi:hypothetical protein